MGLIERAMADLMTSQHELHESLKRLEKTQKDLTKSYGALAKKHEQVAEETSVVVRQSSKHTDLMKELLKHLGGLAETQAELMIRLKALEDKAS